LTFTDVDLKDKRGVDLNAYEQFYELIQRDRSISSNEAEHLFKEITPATLATEVRTESSAAWQKDAKIFQEIQFAPQGDYYRIELHEADRGTHWVYFHHPRILAKLKEILSQ
jgi:hypothetical protein